MEEKLSSLNKKEEKLISLKINGKEKAPENPTLL